MPASNDRNARIALANGWRRACYRQRTPHPNRCEKELGPWCETCPLNVWEEWIDPAGKPTKRPDFVGTLEGVAGMMRELQARRRPMSQWAWYWNDRKQRFEMRYAAWRRSLFRRQVLAVFHSPSDRPGDCVGDAWLSVFEKKVADAS